MVTLVAFAGSSARAATLSKLLPFQGRIALTQGTPAPDGVRVVQFKLYNAPIGGTVVWPGEIHSLTINDGIVSTLLGSKSTLAGVDFNQDLYLEITIDANGDSLITIADPPLLPRQSIVPTVLSHESLDSRRLAGFDWSQLFGTNSPVGAIPGSKLQLHGITAAQLGTNSVTEVAIADQQITAAKLAPSLAADSVIPPGTIMAYAGDIGFGGSRPVPVGWLLCDGTEKIRADYERLFHAIGDLWGAGNGSTTFNVPDLRSYFLRGVDAGAIRDPGLAGRTAHGTNRVDAPGSSQLDQLTHHTHDAPPGNAYVVTGGFHANTLPGYSSGPGLAFVGKGGAISSDARNQKAGEETRPMNVYVNYIIKY